MLASPLMAAESQNNLMPMPTIENWITSKGSVFDPQTETMVDDHRVFIVGDVGSEHRNIELEDDSIDPKDGMIVKTVSGEFRLGTPLTSGSD